MTSDESSLYDELGVPPNATKSEIKRAYRTKAKSVHPDHGGDPADFNRLRKAHKILIDDAKRLTYDRTGKDDEVVDDTAAQAMEVLTGLFVQALDDPRAESEDIIGTMRQLCMEESRLAASQAAQAANNIQRIERLKKRLKRKGSVMVGPLERVFENKIGRLTEHKAERDKRVEIMARAIAILKNYTWEADQAPQFVNSGFYRNFAPHEPGMVK